MEDSTMTIEFLRARLLSERSVSKTARQKADELANRVAELEERLRIVSVQRMKAEKATANVLAILESNGLSDASEAFDSSSDHDDEGESGLVNGCYREVQSSTNSKARKSESDELIPSPARSMSWKSSKDSTGSIKRCKEPALRSCTNTFTSACSSPKRRPGKSCRQIRRKEARAGDMEKVLEQQAQLIERYEEMEKAQREWEEKFRENSSSTPDSCDLGNHSDVTEEAPYEINEQLPNATRTIASTNHLENSEVEDFLKIQPNGDLQQAINKEQLMVQKSSIGPSGSLCHDFACSLVGSKHNEAQLVNICSSSSSSAHEHPQTHGTKGVLGSQLTCDFQSNRASDFNKEKASGSESEVYALVPHKAPKALGILEALKQAKQSLQQQIDKIPSVVASSPVGTSYDISSLLATASGDHTPEIPVRCPGLFRLPADFTALGGSEGNNFHSLHKRSSLDIEVLGSSRTDILSSSVRSSLENYHSEQESKKPEAAVSNQLGAMPQYSEHKMKFSTDNHLLTSKEYLDGASMQRQHINPSIDVGLPSSRSVYPAFPVSPVYGDLMFQVPPSEGFSTFPEGRTADGSFTSPAAGPAYGDMMLQMSLSEGFSTIPPGRRTSDGISPPADRFSFCSPYAPDMYR